MFIHSEVKLIGETFLKYSEVRHLKSLVADDLQYSLIPSPKDRLNTLNNKLQESKREFFLPMLSLSLDSCSSFHR